MTQNVSETEQFEVREPEMQRIPFVFNSPHSGRVYSSSFLKKSRLDHLSIRRSEDHFVDQLFHCVTDLGAPPVNGAFPARLS